MALSDPTPVTNFVQRLAIGSEIDAAELGALIARESELRPFEGQRDFLREDEEFAFLIIEGVVARFGQAKDGTRQTTCLYIPGDVANLGAVVTPRPSLNLQAISNGAALEIPLAALRDVVNLYPRTALGFWRASEREAAIAAEWMLKRCRLKAVQNLAHLLCESGWRSRGGPVADGGSYRFPLTQTQLSDVLGLTAVHVNRMVKEIRALRLADMKDQIVQVLKWTDLARLGEFDPAYLAPEPVGLQDRYCQSKCTAAYQ